MTSIELWTGSALAPRTAQGVDKAVAFQLEARPAQQLEPPDAHPILGHYCDRIRRCHWLWAASAGTGGGGARFRTSRLCISERDQPLRWYGSALEARAALQGERPLSPSGVDLALMTALDQQAGALAAATEDELNRICILGGVDFDEPGRLAIRAERGAALALAAVLEAWASLEGLARRELKPLADRHVVVVPSGVVELPVARTAISDFRRRGYMLTLVPATSLGGVRASLEAVGLELQCPRGEGVRRPLRMLGAAAALMVVALGIQLMPAGQDGSRGGLATEPEPVALAGPEASAQDEASGPVREDTEALIPQPAAARGRSAAEARASTTPVQTGTRPASSRSASAPSRAVTAPAAAASQAEPPVVAPATSPPPRPAPRRSPAEEDGVAEARTPQADTPRARPTPGVAAASPPLSPLLVSAQPPRSPRLGVSQAAGAPRQRRTAGRSLVREESLDDISSPGPAGSGSRVGRSSGDSTSFSPSLPRSVTSEVAERALDALSERVDTAKGAAKGAEGSK